jgi:ATP-dependent DNA helicase DinG
VEKNLVPPVYENADLFLEQSVRRAAELVEASGGRALILLSTWKALKRFRDGFEEARRPYPVKFQGDESPSRLITWLKTTPGAVLVGTRTFWEGVDVPGEALSLVVIDKVPFPPPSDPVVQEALREGREQVVLRGLVAEGADVPAAGRRSADPHPR